MPRERATKKQQELLQFIGDFIAENNYAPSYREIMNRLGYKSVSTVAVHVDGLIAKGYLTKSDRSARSIRLASESPIPNENTHLAWLRTEIMKRETAKADAAEIEALQRALAILEEQ
jgi:SOS-response transcriptional repressor LexA